MVACFPPLLPQEQHVLPYQRPAQSYQNLKQKQINKRNKDQERRRLRYDPILVSYAYLLPILVNVGAMVPKPIKPAKFPYNHKYDHHATCGYHVGYVGRSTEVCHALKTKVQELTDRNLLCFTPVTAKVLIEKEFEYKGPPIHVQVTPPVVQPAMQYPNQRHHTGMSLAYPGASSSTVVAPQYTYVGAPYTPFEVHYGYTSRHIINPGLGHSAQMFHMMAIPPTYSPSQVP